MKLLILDHETLKAPIIEFDDFARDNADDPDLVEQARNLAPRAGFIVGGGAAATFTITRWS